MCVSVVWRAPSLCPRLAVSCIAERAETRNRRRTHWGSEWVSVVHTECGEEEREGCCCESLQSFSGGPADTISRRTPIPITLSLSLKAQKHAFNCHETLISNKWKIFSGEKIWRIKECFHSNTKKNKSAKIDTVPIMENACLRALALSTIALIATITGAEARLTEKGRRNK